MRLKNNIIYFQLTIWGHGNIYGMK